ncbi:AAA family ATPase [Nocardioides sp. Leaf374]|uniref:AAA family ATPase n=1 Tax=Nocardioides sp. Leaf374 TaxID=2876560 RepID=UPI001E55F833|nr:AAA family ATPase [Nocardioides sp. Leaf374]
MTAQRPHVVVGVGESAPGRAALRWAHDLCRDRGWVLDVVTAWPDLGEQLVREVPGHFCEARHRLVTAQAEALGEAGVDVDGPDVQVHVVNGDPVDALVDRSAQAVMLVVGTSGEGRSAAAGHPAIGERCRAAVTCPVVVVDADRVPTGAGPVACETGRPWVTGVEPWVELRRTHSGAVLLVGDHALKLKLPVRLGFLDFSTREARVAAVRRELQLNRRFAPGVYEGLATLGPAEDDGEPVVVMRRLPDGARLGTRVRGGAEVSDSVVAVARLVTSLHDQSPRRAEIDHEGTALATRERWRSTLDQMRAASHPGVDDADLAEIDRLAQTYLAGRAALFERRVADGRVVDGHGDLLAEDVFEVDGRPQLLDCLDFDDRLRYVDGLDDVCCLAMDLERLGDPAAARLLVRSYTARASDPAPTSLVHHFTAYRALVRAKVGCLQGAADGEGEVARHVRLGLDHLRAGAVRLVLVGGPPGTGKTTLAEGLAQRCGHAVVSSDRIRKELAGLDPDTPAPAAYATGLYARDVTARTYEEMLRRAGRLLAMGETVVLDATWGDDAHREQARRLAAGSSAALVALRCSLSLASAQERIGRRSAGPSDADADIAARARAAWSPWPDAHRVDTALPAEECVDRAADVVARTSAAVEGVQLG